MLLLIVSWYIFLLLGFFSYIFPQYYFSELFLSFLPYHLFLLFLWLIIFLVLFRRQLNQQRISEIHIRKSLLWWLLLLFWLLFLLFSRKFNNFYRFPVEGIKTEMTWWVKILYGNIYKNNINYTWISHLIEKENPDLILFVEFADQHYENIKDILDSKYPYSNSTIWSQKYVGNMVFSKYRINNRADDFPQWARRYGYFSIDYDQNPLYFYLVHMSSPSNVGYFHMRNNQISTFFKDFDLHKEVHRERNDKVIVIWDFNTSPWSYFYWNFAHWFSWEFINITRSFPILFTWTNLSLPIFWAHIDHVFVNKLVNIKNLHLVDLPGSDHRWFTFWIK